MKVFLSVKYHADQNNRPRIEAILAALEKCGHQTLCIVRDVECWGQIHFDENELMRRTFAEIDDSNLVLVDLTEKGVGIGIEVGYAFGKHIPIVTITERDADVSSTLRGISRTVLRYDHLNQLDTVLKGIEKYAR